MTVSIACTQCVSRERSRKVTRVTYQKLNTRLAKQVGITSTIFDTIITFYSSRALFLVHVVFGKEIKVLEGNCYDCFLYHESVYFNKINLTLIQIYVGAIAQFDAQ